MHYTEMFFAGYASFSAKKLLPDILSSVLAILKLTGKPLIRCLN
jgi:hypothetical protein